MNCPNKSSKEWKEIMQETNGNEERAYALWEERGHSKKDELNEDKDFKDERTGKVETPQEEELKDPMSNLVKDIKIYLNKKLEMLKNKKVKDQANVEARYKKLLSTLDGVEGLQSILLFIEDTYNNSVLAQENFEKLKKNIKAGKYNRQESIERLVANYDFANGYSILDEIDKADIREILDVMDDPEVKDKTNKITPKMMLKQSLAIREEIKNDFISYGIPLMADFLLDYAPKDTEERAQVEIESIQNQITKLTLNKKITDKYREKEIQRLRDRIVQFQSFSLDKQSLIKLLTEASADIGVIDFLFSPLISSEDAPIALFAKAIKSQLEIARIKSLDLIEELSNDFLEYAKTSGLSIDNKSKFNEGIYEVIDVPIKNKETGEWETVQRAAFVQKFDMSRYNKAKSEFFKELGDKPVPADPENPTKAEIKALREWGSKVGTWNRENTQPLPIEQINKIVADKKKELEKGIITQSEYDQWIDDNMWYDQKNDFIVYKKELTQPANKYINTKWSELYDETDKPKNAKGKYHKKLLDTYLASQELIPVNQRPGYFLPSIPKTEFERLGTQNILKTAKRELQEALTKQDYDTMYGLTSLGQEGVKFIPVHYISKMDADDVSKDLARSVLMFADMANRYDAINQVYGEVNMFKKIIGERKVLQTNSKGQPILDAFAKKLGYTEFIRQNGEAYSEKHVNAFIDMIVYGEMQKAEEIFGLSADKITNKLTGFSALTSIAADILKGVANNLQGNIQMIIEANSGEFFTRKNLRVGTLNFAKNIPGLISDFAHPTPKSMLGRLMQYYDALQGEFTDTFGQKVSSSVALKLMSTNTLFFNQHFGEIEIQGSAMLALMDNTFVTDNETGEKISLLEAHTKYGTKEVLEKTDFTEKKRQDFQNRLHALSKRMHGVYNNFDKGTAQRYSLGRLTLMYRKHVIPGYKRRYKKLSYDQELQSWTEGYYRTFWDLYLKQLTQFKFSTMKKWSTLSPFEKAQVNRVIGEATLILSFSVLVLALILMVNDDDDDLKKNYAYNFLLYEAIRMRSETASYISPIDAYRIFKSPSAMTSTFERAIRFTNQILPWNITESYERKTGVWNKGDNKAWAYFMKLIGYSGYNTNPDEAVKAFKASINK